MFTIPNESDTLPALFARRIQTTPDLRAFRQFRGGQWVDFTCAQAAREVGRWQAALRKEGLKPGDRVAICSKNRIEWMFFDQAAMGLGLVVVPLYFNDRPDNMAWCLNDAEARLLVLEHADLWSSLCEQARTIERVVLLGGAGGLDGHAVALEAWLGAATAEDRGYECVSGKPEDIATIVYTSGTTGRPKGVVLTHWNIVSDLIALIDAVPELLQPGHRFLSFLPLSHMFERTVGYYIPICLAAQITYARSIQELADDLVTQRPTIIVSVPRIFERIFAKIEADLRPGSQKRRLFDTTAEVGWRRFKGEATLADRLLWPILDKLVARKLRARLGGRLQYILLGASALSPRLLKIFTGMGLTFIHGYGLTETSPVISANRLRENEPLSVGRPLKGVETRVLENGELVVRGPMVTRGYWRNPEGTRAVIDDEGWFHTGDVVEVRDSRIYIRGRVKDVIVLSNGEKVPPADVEEAIQQDPAFEQAMVVGEGRPYLTLIAVSTVQDQQELRKRADKQMHAFPGYAKVRRVLRVEEPFTVENGLLTPTLKLKRNKIEERYAKEIEELYQRTERRSRARV